MAENKGQSTAGKSFEEVYKTSYSHGLESIYRLENIDLKTVRKLGGEEDSTPKKRPLPILDQKSPELDLGPILSGYLTSFVLREPIQSLKLTRHIEKNLIDQGITTLKDLSKVDFTALSFVKGLGQGHIVELKERLQQRLNEPDALKPKSIDFASWVRSLTAELEAKMAWAFLEPYGLQSAVPLTPLETVEIKKLTVERKQDFIDQAKQKIKSPHKVKLVRDRLSEIETVFLRPWVLGRGGVARENEIEERILSLSKEQDYVVGTLQFLKDYYVEGSLFQLPGKNGLIFASAEEWGEFSLLENKVLECLWNSDAKVAYQDLLKWISKDMALSWKALSTGLLEKVIAFSPRIKREKAFNGDLMIRRKIEYVRD